MSNMQEIKEMIYQELQELQDETMALQTKANSQFDEEKNLLEVPIIQQMVKIIQNQNEMLKKGQLLQKIQEQHQKKTRPVTTEEYEEEATPLSATIRKALRAEQQHPEEDDTEPPYDDEPPEYYDESEEEPEKPQKKETAPEKAKRIKKLLAHLFDTFQETPLREKGLIPKKEDEEITKRTLNTLTQSGFLKKSEEDGETYYTLIEKWY